MLEAIKKRRSIRSYTSQEVEDEKINEILKAAMASPNAAHKRPWHFVVVRDPKKKEELSQASAYSSFAKQASAIIAVCADEPGAYRWIEDSSIAAAHIYLEATNQGLGTCMIQIRDMENPGSSADDAEAYVKEKLNIPEKFRVLCLMPIGYPGEEKPEHGDEAFEEDKIHEESW